MRIVSMLLMTYRSYFYFIKLYCGKDESTFKLGIR